MIVRPLHQYLFRLDGDMDFRWNSMVQSTSGSHDLQDRIGQLDLHVFWNGNGDFADSRHGISRSLPDIAEDFSPHVDPSGLLIGKDAF